ncbi:MAG: hypothetical protein ABWY23_04500 [Mycetocola sp.]
MSEMWISRFFDHDRTAESIRFVITDGAEQQQIRLQRSENAALYDFIVAHELGPV